MNKIAFIILAVNQKYIDIAEITCKKLLEYTEADVILYYANGNVEPYSSHRVRKIDLASFDFDYDYVSFWTPLKPFIAKEALKKYDTVINLDADIQVSPNINQYKKYLDHQDPIFTCYSGGSMYLIWYNTDGTQTVIDWVPETVREHIPYEDEYKGTPVLFTGFFIVNKRHEFLMNEWYEKTTKILNLKNIEEFNRQSQACIHEEAILNSLIRKHKIKTNINPKFVVVWLIEGVVEVFDMINKKIPWVHSELIYEYGEVKLIYAKQKINNNQSIVPPNIEDFWGFHCVKQKEYVYETYRMIEEHFNKIK
jgi:hypothetical protein